MFTYEELYSTIKSMNPGSAGRSVWGRELLFCKIGDGRRKLFINGAHHGTEYITAKLCMDLCTYIKERTHGWSVYIMPMVNPDGVAVAQGLLPKNTETYEKLRRMNCWNDIYRTWQANANGVDLNHNYDALFHRLNDRGPSRHGGAYPESEPETKAIVNLVKKERFDMVMCLHSQGEVIYHGFNGHYPKGSVEIAEAFKSVSGYNVEEPEHCASFGGMKDWFVDKFDKPGFTLEVGKGENPLDDEDALSIEKRIFPAIEKAILTYNEVLC